MGAGTPAGRNCVTANSALTFPSFPRDVDVAAALEHDGARGMHGRPTGPVLRFVKRECASLDHHDHQPLMSVPPRGSPGR